MEAACLLVLGEGDKAIKIYPGKPIDILYGILGLGSHGELQVKRELELCNAIIAIDSGLKEVWLHKAICEDGMRFMASDQHQQRWADYYEEKALNSVDEALSIDENYEAAWFKKAYFYNRGGSYDEVYKCYDKLKKINEHSKYLKRFKLEVDKDRGLYKAKIVD